MLKGGEVPITANHTVRLPAAINPAIVAQLHTITIAWKPWQKAIRVVLTAEPGSPALAQVIETIEASGLPLLQQMDRAVKVHVSASTQKLTWLKLMQVGCVLVTLAVAIIGLVVIGKQLVRPKLVALINELHEAVTIRKGSEALRTILGELADYVTFRFAAAEALLQHHDYPEFDAHQAAHVKFTDKLGDLQQKFESGKAGVALSVLGFLKD